MGLSHSKHYHQYQKEKQRIHAYQKSSIRRARSATGTANTRRISSSSNNKQSFKTNPNQEKKIQRKKVVYYPSDYFETGVPNPTENTDRNKIYSSLGIQRVKSQGKMQLSHKESPYYSIQDVNNRNYEQRKEQSRMDSLPQTSIVVSPQKNEKKFQLENPIIQSIQLDNNYTERSAIKQKQKIKPTATQYLAVNQHNSRQIHPSSQNFVYPHEQYYNRNTQLNPTQSYTIKISNQINDQKLEHKYPTTNLRNLTDVYNQKKTPVYYTAYRGPYGNEHGTID